MDKNIKKAYLFLISQFFSVLGSAIVDYILIWYITLKSGSGIVLSSSLILTYLPKIMGSVFAERKILFHRVKVALITSDLLVSGFSTILAVLIFLKLDTYPILLTIMALRAIGSGIQGPCEKVLLTELTPVMERSKMNGLNTIITSLCGLFSPAIGAIIVINISIESALMLDLITVFCAVFILLLIKINYEVNDKFEKNNFENTDLKIKVIFVWHVIFTFLIVPIAFFTPLLIKNCYSGDVSKLAINEMAYSFGAIVAGMFVGKIAKFCLKYNILSVLSFLTGVFIIILENVSKNFVLYCFVMFTASFFITVFQTYAVTILQKLSTQENRINVFSRLEILTNISIPIGMLCWGGISDAVTIENSLLMSGIGLCFESMFMLILQSRIKEKLVN